MPQQFFIQSHKILFLTFIPFRGLCKAAVKHSAKNRYCNLFPFDACRVQLEVPEDKPDYINASWIHLPGVEMKFILTMAPLHPWSFSASRSTDFEMDRSVSTCEDFWRMVQQTDVTKIVMLCKVTLAFYFKVFPWNNICLRYNLFINFQSLSVTLF